MISFDRIRLKAWEVREQLSFQPDGSVAASEIIDALQAFTGVLVLPVAGDDPLLSGAQAVLDASFPAIYQNDELPPEVKLFDAAHEFGHWFLHSVGIGQGKCECAHSDLTFDDDGLESLPGSTVIGYSSRERRESEANIFASEILFPLPLARKSFEISRWTSSRIASELGIIESLVRHQLTDALLMPLPAIRELHKAPSPQPLDDSQLAATNVQHGPLLVSAGPGTGKTKTLVGRCQHLVRENRVRPDMIVALTYSRKAAAEMLERLQIAGVGAGSIIPWVGTFHSFGNEILRKYGERIGLSSDFQLIDQIDAVLLLERNLVSLQLNELVNVHAPGQHLPGVLNAIRKAKDDLCGPERYYELAVEFQQTTNLEIESLSTKPGKKLKKDEDRIARLQRDAARAIEIARCYEVYQELLIKENLVDYGDLIVRSVELLTSCPDVREMLHRKYPHVLADEYQDVNRASARLLRLLVGADAAGLWVVGDHRQSIYQFQGASPANISLFQHEYPSGHEHQLLVNYRSVSEIVDTFGLAASSLSFNSSGQEYVPWIAARGKSPTLEPAAELVALNSSSDQSEYLQAVIEKRRAAGMPWSKQAVLCRKHSHAREVCDALNKLGIPTLYLGQLLERPEIKNLISVIAVCADGQTAAAARMAMMTEYGLSEAEALRYIAGTAEPDSEITGTIEPSGTPLTGFELMKAHIAALRPLIERPSELVRAYIFEVSRFLDTLPSNGLDAFGITQSKMAVRQFIDLADSFNRRPVTSSDSEGLNRASQFLAYLRRVASFGATANLPEGDAISEIEAVRVMTIHSAKGLEFPVVYVPNLNEGQFPPRTPHDGMPDIVGQSDSEEIEANEEECLFFVALSRARDYLILTWYRYRDNGSEVKPSVLISSLSEAEKSGAIKFVDCTKDSHIRTNEDEAAGRDSDSQNPLPLYSSSELEEYMRCPRSYYYEKVAAVNGTKTDIGYLTLHRVVRELVDWVESETANGHDPSQDERNEKLNSLWLNSGLSDHPFVSLYFAEAQRIANAEPVEHLNKARSIVMTAKLKNALVQVRPDRIEIEADKVNVSRRILHKPKDDDHTDKRLALYRRAVTDTFPNAAVTVELQYLVDGSKKTVSESSRWEPARVGKYEDAVDGILDGRYPAHPSNMDNCSTCQFLFVCSKKETVRDV